MTGRWGPGPAMPWQLYAKKRAERQEQEQKPRVTGSGRVYLPPGNKRLNHPHTPGRPITSIAHLLHIHELSDLEPRPETSCTSTNRGPDVSPMPWDDIGDSGTGSRPGAASYRNPMSFPGSRGDGTKSALDKPRGSRSGVPPRSGSSMH
ncbi:hypothetical protein CYMTET_49990 [Cymbomonas tetramitiformis]|uniref:Uncharacterized protein n=1 Tax=Cymbomonas tetramitiformis TaxID=36881 RepID=A0AAE0BP27_9CHLO|nr:hypothetical protein CYMTET_49990 [Cymbomonas tetramitiformis]